MVNAVRRAASGTPAPPDSEKRRSTWKRRVGLAVVGLVIFVLGVACGNGGGSPAASQSGQGTGQHAADAADPADADSTAALAELEAQVSERQAELDEAAASIEARADEVDDLRVRLDEERSTLDARKQKLDARKQKLDERKAALDEREDRLDAQAQDPSADDSSDDTGSAGQSVYYGNCSEARAAGAAPLFAGEPGYAGHLDGDGDGVACES